MVDGQWKIDMEVSFNKLIAEFQQNTPTIQAQGEGGGQGQGDPVRAQHERVNKSNKSFLKSTLGIQVGIAALLKQSQIFTGVVGTIFQLIGALVDVILAPFLPIIVPAIRLMASFIPKVAAFSRKIYEVVEPWIAKLEGAFEKLPGDFGSAIHGLLAGLILVSFWAKLFGLWGPWQRLLTGTVNLMAGALEKIVIWTGGMVATLAREIGLAIWFSAGGKYLRDIADSMFIWLEDAIRPMTDALAFVGVIVENGAKEIWSILDDIFPKGRWMRTLASAIADATKGIFGKVMSGAARAFGAVKGAAVDVFTSAGTVQDKPPSLPSGGGVIIKGKDWIDPKTGLVMTAESLKKGGYGVDALGNLATISPKFGKAAMRFVRMVPFLGTLVEAGLSIAEVYKATERVIAGEAAWWEPFAQAGVGLVAIAGSFGADVLAATNPWLALIAGGALAITADVGRDLVRNAAKFESAEGALMEGELGPPPTASMIAENDRVTAQYNAVNNVVVPAPQVNVEIYVPAVSSQEIMDWKNSGSSGPPPTINPALS